MDLHKSISNISLSFQFLIESFPSLIGTIHSFYFAIFVFNIFVHDSNILWKMKNSRSIRLSTEFALTILEKIYVYTFAYEFLRSFKLILCYISNIEEVWLLSRRQLYIFLRLLRLFLIGYF